MEAKPRVFDAARVKFDVLKKLVTYTLREHHAQHGADTWIPIPDLADAVGMASQSVEPVLREMLADQQVQLESCRVHGFTDERYRRGANPNMGWWPAVKLLPPEVAAQRKKAIEEHRAKLDRAAHLVNEALRMAYGEKLGVVAKAYDDGVVALEGIDEGTDVVEALLKVDPKASSGKSSSARKSR